MSIYVFYIDKCVAIYRIKYQYIYKNIGQLFYLDYCAKGIIKDIRQQNTALSARNTPDFFPNFSLQNKIILLSDLLVEVQKMHCCKM